MSESTRLALKDPRFGRAGILVIGFVMKLSTELRSYSKRKISGEKEQVRNVLNSHDMISDNLSDSYATNALMPLVV